MVFSIALILSSLLIVGSISYYRSVISLEREARNSNSQVIEQVDLHVTEYVKDIEKTVLKIINHPTMSSLLVMTSVEQISESHIRGQVETLFQETAFSRPDVFNITIILDNLQVISLLGPRAPVPLSKLKQEYWYSAVQQNNSYILKSQVVEKDGVRQPVISCIRRVFNPQTLEPVGILVVDINFYRLEEISRKANLGAKKQFSILDAAGYYVYHEDSSKIGEQAKFLENSGYLEEPDDTVTFIDTTENSLTIKHSPYLGWTFVMSTPYIELIRESVYIRDTMLWTILIMVFVSYLAAVRFAKTIVDPIDKLHKVMNRVEKGDFSAQVQVRSTNEIGQLSAGFNKMTQRLAELVDAVYKSRLKESEMNLKQKEMELKMLYSQVNPHFVCNALETIRGMSLEENIDSVADVAAALSQLLRYSLKIDAPLVSLQEEISFCQAYLAIQQARFRREVDFQFDIPEWAGGLQVVRCSLQPIIENCFIHGMRGRRECLQIIVSAAITGDANLNIKVADTGVGMSEDAVMKIEKHLRSETPLDGGKGIGLTNVHKRIKHLFGNEYGLSIESTLGKGTTVTFKYPARNTSAMGDNGGVTNEYNPPSR